MIPKLSVFYLGEMREVLSIDFEQQTMCVRIPVSPSGSGKAYGVSMEQYPPMLATGLHDKNGKEIYEGDIVEHAYWTRFPIKNKVWWDNTRAGFVVDSSLHQPKPDGGRDWALFLKEFASYCKVIGNTYENPELLMPKDQKSE